MFPFTLRANRYDAGEGAAPQCEFFDRRDGNYDDGKAYEKKRAFTIEEVSLDVSIYQFSLLSTTMIISLRRQQEIPASRAQ